MNNTRSIKFDNFDTNVDWGLILNKLDLSTPTPRFNFVEVPHHDGVLDFSDVVTGNVIYDVRELKCEFDLITRFDEREKIIKDIVNKLHGNKVKITLPDNQTQHLIGRVTVNVLSKSAYLNKIEVIATCDPYFYNNTVTQKTINITTSEQEETIINSKMRVVPEITTNKKVSIILRGETFDIDVGTYTNIPLELYEGENKLILKGQVGTTLQFIYREGSL